MKVIQDGAKLLQNKKYIPDRIIVKKHPDKTAYFEGEIFDPTGIELELVFNNGSSRTTINIDDIITPSDPLTLNDTTVTIKYPYKDSMLETIIPITVESDIQFILIDFYYVRNGNGTYTLTGWKGTLNGIESTKLVIPVDNRIIL